GMNLAIMQKELASVASEMRCMDVRFDPIHHNQGRALVHIGRRDSLARSHPWPWLALETTNFLGAIPAGFDRNGKPITMDLRSRHVLVGGISDSGKSCLLHTIIAAGMGDVRVKVHLLDGKMGVELSAWENAAASFATDDEPELAMKILKRLEGRVNKIFGGFRSVSERKADWSKIKEVNLLVIDEFTAFLPIPGFQKTLTELLRRGRAAGLIVVLATQRPSSKVVDTDLRELFHYRVAFWSDKAGSKMILGDGVEDDSSEFSGLNPGEMILLVNGHSPTRCRGYLLTDKDLAHLAARAVALRSKDDVPNGSVPSDVGQVKAVAGSDTPPGSVRSPGPKSGLSLVPPSLPVPSQAPERAVEPLARLTRELRATLTAIALHGPQVPGPELQARLKLSASATSYRANQLYRAGLVSRARRTRPDGKGEGGRDPWLWSITELGNKALTEVPAKAGIADKAGKETAS
ncbi:MAG TPA: FtsK/SpoIIIE domain-containing protein, partial [Actinomycetota bacterium]|nr:FtsK/SpoIIIE domain-containing protein [Actinomycetota bacterium]